MLTTLLIGLGISLLINLALFIVAYAFKTDKLTDASYGLTFLALAVWALIRARGVNFYNDVLFVMIGLWALRLGGFLVLRVLKAGHDKRFDGRREHFWKFGQFWLGQALTVWVVMLAASQALTHAAPFTAIAALGLVIWLVGLTIETCADYQKFVFRTKPANKDRWIASGLWRYSRHPNYFGEMTVWVGVYLYALGTLNVGEAILGLLSPLAIIALLLFVSGIPPLEKSADQRWGDVKDYQAYKAHTNRLIPRPVK